MAVTATTSTTGTTTSTTSASAAGLSANFDMFLKLLTTQMQNQDPLKPMDSTEYTQQLAQFSQVEQTVKQTSTLNDILAQLSTQNVAQASNFIGKTATFDYAVSGLSASTPAQWSYSASSPVSDLSAKITDASGKVVATQALSPDQEGEFSWNGTLANGGQAPPGAYTLALTGKTLQGSAVPVTITTSGLIDQVMGGNGAVTLGVNGVQIPMTKLTTVAK